VKITKRDQWGTELFPVFHFLRLIIDRSFIPKDILTDPIMRVLPFFMISLPFLLIGCSDAPAPAEAIPAEPVTATAAAPSGRVYKTTLENVPDWVPLPEEYTVIMDQGTGVGSIAIEVPGDIRAVVARMNEQLVAQGHPTIKEKEKEGKGYIAQGVISDNTKGMAVINVGEYDGPGSSYKPGNTASISYMITSHNLQD
jgi:hypothetical protein